MGVVVSINGRFVEAHLAAVPALDRGVLYGDGVFEVLRSYAGVAWCVDEHLARLYASARCLGMSVPVTAAQLRGELLEALERAGDGDAHVRVVVTRGAGDLGVAPSNARAPTRMIAVSPYADLDARDHHVRGIRVRTVNLPWLARTSPWSGAKTLNYLPSVLCAQRARGEGAHEALLVADGDIVLEAASANVFIAQGASLTTPPAEHGILCGITRELVLRLARQVGLEAREAPVTLTDLWTADEIFLTSSVREVIPVVRVDEHEVGDGSPGDATRRVHRAYRAATPAAGRPMPWE